MDPQTALLTILLLLLAYVILRFVLNLATQTTTLAFSVFLPNVESFQPPDKRAQKLKKLYHNTFVKSVMFEMVAPEVEIAFRAAEEAMKKKKYRQAIPHYKKAIKIMAQQVWDSRIQPKQQRLINKLKEMRKDEGFAGYREQRGISADKLKQLLHDYKTKMKKVDQEMKDGELDQAVEEADQAVKIWEPLTNLWADYKANK